MFLKSALEELGIEYESVELGKVQTREELTEELLHQLRIKLMSAGLDLLNDKKQILVERIKHLIIERVHHSEVVPATSDSEYLEEKLGYDYTYLSNTFSEVKGMTIKHYIILHKIERAKELLLYGEQTLTEIAANLRYSSVGHLSNQFKEVTGLTPSYFKELKDKKLNHLEDL
ncbi:MAG: helix-turn-helix domain-containing protein [Balneolaceae bacterium]